MNKFLTKKRQIKTNTRAAKYIRIYLWNNKQGKFKEAVLEKKKVCSGI